MSDMRAIVVDPYEKRVYELEWPSLRDGSEYRKIVEVIGQAGLDSVRIAAHPDGTFDYLWVDDVGLSRPNQRYFMWEGYLQPLAGIAVIVGTSEGGDTIPTLIDEGWVRGQITWVRPDVEFVRMDKTRDDVNHPVFGHMKGLTLTPIFRIKTTGELVKSWE